MQLIAPTSQAGSGADLPTSNLPPPPTGCAKIARYVNERKWALFAWAAAIVLTGFFGGFGGKFVALGIAAFALGFEAWGCVRASNAAASASPSSAVQNLKPATKNRLFIRLLEPSNGQHSDPAKAYDFLVDQEAIITDETIKKALNRVVLYYTSSKPACGRILQKLFELTKSRGIEVDYRNLLDKACYSDVSIQDQDMLATRIAKEAGPGYKFWPSHATYFERVGDIPGIGKVDCSASPWLGT